MSGASLAYPFASTAVAGVIQIATTAVQKAGSNNALCTTPSIQGFHQTATKIAASISSAGTLNGGFGVASVSLTGAEYTINFSAAMVDTNYSVNCTPEVDSVCNLTLQVKSKTTTSCIVKPMTICNTGSATTNTAFSIAVNGSLA